MRRRDHWHCDNIRGGANVKRFLIAAAVLVGAMFVGGPAPANAYTAVWVGPGWHHGHHWRRHHHGWRHAYGRGHCRVVVKHRWRHGHRIKIRKRVCW
jgi:hypothetical protein